MAQGYSCFKRSNVWQYHYLVPLSTHKMFLQSCEEDKKQISPGSTNHFCFVFLFVCCFFFGDLGGVALKLEKTNFFHFFFKFQSMSVTFHSCRPLQQTTRNSFNAYIIIVLNNKIGLLLSVTKRIKLQNSFTLSLKLVLHQGYSNSQALRHFS